MTGRDVSVIFFMVSMLLSMVASMLMPMTASAASSNITTSPISQDVTVIPGTSSTTNLQMQNNGESPVTINVELETFKADGVTGQARVEDFAPNDPTPSWVHFSEKSFVAEPGVWKQVQMTITLPKDANLGYYYAVLFRPVLSNSPASPSTNTYNLSNAILILVDTGSKNEVRQLQVSSLTSTHKLYQYLPASFNILVHNTGNIYTPPAGELYISKQSDFSHVLATMDINKSGGRVLPQSSRQFTVSWTDGFPVYQPKMVGGQPVRKKGQPVLQLHYNFAQANRFRFGKYYAKMVLVYNNGQRDVPVVGTVSFWVIPWKILLAVLLLIILQVGFIVVAIRYRHMYRSSNASAKRSSAENIRVKVRHRDRDEQ